LIGIAARDRLIVALDFASVETARALVARLGSAVTFYKIGLELVLATDGATDGARGGIGLARELSESGKRVFLDMKLLDIENTVERATRNAATTGATFLTVHAHDGKTLRAAMAGKAGTGLRLLAVTVLTNLDGEDLREQGIAEAPAELVARRAGLARAAGCDGVVASGLEAARVRAVVGPGLAIVTPGIRLAGEAAGDQARTATPQAAVAAGADYLVVGRSIGHAPDPLEAAERFVQAIEEGLIERGERGRGSDPSPPA
jgi:orotidine-5'-phosphate decarboxylase